MCVCACACACVCNRSNILQFSRSIYTYPHIPTSHPPNWRRSLWKPCLQGRKLCPWPWHGVTCQLRHGPAKLNGGSMGVQWTHRGIRVHSQTIHVWRIHANLSYGWIGNTWEIAPNLVAMAPHSSSWLIGNQHRASVWPNRLLSFWLLTVMWFQYIPIQNPKRLAESRSMQNHMIIGIRAMGPSASFDMQNEPAGWQVSLDPLDKGRLWFPKTLTLLGSLYNCYNQGYNPLVNH